MRNYKITRRSEFPVLISLKRIKRNEFHGFHLHRVRSCRPETIFIHSQMLFLKKYIFVHRGMHSSARNENVFPKLRTNLYYTVKMKCPESVSNEDLWYDYDFFCKINRITITCITFWTHQPFSLFLNFIKSHVLSRKLNSSFVCFWGLS